MSKHTSGTWFVIYNKKGYPYQISALNGYDKRPGAVGTRITRWASIGRPSSIEGQANAQLIAAAPELLEALKGIVNFYSGTGTSIITAFDKARAAINKAEGKA